MPDAGRLREALAGWRDWPLPITAPPKVLGPIDGGRTNRNIKLLAPGLNHPIILRLHNSRARQLGINREQEAQIIYSVSRAGITPEPLYRDPENRFALLPYIKGRAWTAADFQREDQQLRLLTLLKKVRALTPAVPRRSYLQYLEHYWQQLLEAKAVDNDLKRRWQNFRPRLEVFDQQRWPALLTHHDLIPENIIDSGDHLYLIDWEYAALGHSDIDLWCIDPALCHEPFIPKLATWTNELWERVLTILPKP